jgi:hypothetical protein
LRRENIKKDMELNLASCYGDLTKYICFKNSRGKVKMYKKGKGYVFAIFITWKR